MMILMVIAISLMLFQPREEFISRLLSMLKPQPCTSPGDAASSTEDFDSWEDRLNDEVITQVFTDAETLYNKRSK